MVTRSRLVNVIVTGAAGFIGFHVARYLEDCGYHVLRTDIRVPRDGGALWRKADLTSFDEMVALTDGVEAVCHLGGIGDVYLADRNPQLAMHVNGCGTLNLLEACRLNRVRRFVYASTWEVYGEPRYEPIDESHPCAPSNPYSISKLAGDLYTQRYGPSDELRRVVLRLGTAYGPRMRDNAVMVAFILRALAGRPLEIHGSGTQFRQFTHVRDISRAFGLALELDNSEEVFNVTSPERIAIKDLAELIAKRIPGDVVHREERSGEPVSAFIGSAKAEQRLGWVPQVKFRQGLDELVEEFLLQHGRTRVD